MTTVLVVDDEAPIRLLCRVNLEAEGMTVLEAADGEKGLELARAEIRDRAKGIDLGGVDYVTKPFNPVELAPLVEDLVRRVESGGRDDLRREKFAEVRELLERD